MRRPRPGALHAPAPLLMLRRQLSPRDLFIFYYRHLTHRRRIQRALSRPVALVGVRGISDSLCAAAKRVAKPRACSTARTPRFQIADVPPAVESPHQLTTPHVLVII